ncbi:MAG: hypothetical protein KR126chlam4_01206 [Candidatus Anoxychlamydiales bacterium]|nr:hypothetical protein [Candidatus Anoxychlamydiales bacterium]NGX41367.1 hypothetical protein [Candidatus Anoxychlamydiales bacterium]HEU64684.1 hypothetical protein [Chlamydiota bacterium]
MAAPAPKGEYNRNAKNQLNNLRNKLNNWKNKQNEFSDVEAQQIREIMNNVNKDCNQIGGKFTKDWNNFRKNLDSKLNNPKKMDSNDFKNFNNQIQQLMKELK